LPEGCRAEDCFILEDLADVLIMIKETNNERLDEIFGLPLKGEVRCGMRCGKHLAAIRRRPCSISG
jgi:hypothetical protein